MVIRDVMRGHRIVIVRPIRTRDRVADRDRLIRVKALIRHDRARIQSKYPLEVKLWVEYIY